MGRLRGQRRPVEIALVTDEPPIEVPSPELNRADTSSGSDHLDEFTWQRGRLPEPLRSREPEPSPIEPALPVVLWVQAKVWARARTAAQWVAMGVAAALVLGAGVGVQVARINHRHNIEAERIATLLSSRGALLDLSEPPSIIWAATPTARDGGEAPLPWSQMFDLGVEDFCAELPDIEFHFGTDVVGVTGDGLALTATSIFRPNCGSNVSGPGINNLNWETARIEISALDLETGAAAWTQDLVGAVSCTNAWSRLLSGSPTSIPVIEHVVCLSGFDPWRMTSRQDAEVELLVISAAGEVTRQPFDGSLNQLLNSLMSGTTIVMAEVIGEAQPATMSGDEIFGEYVEITMETAVGSSIAFSLGETSTRVDPRPVRIWAVDLQTGESLWEQLVEPLPVVSEGDAQRLEHSIMCQGGWHEEPWVFSEGGLIGVEACGLSVMLTSEGGILALEFGTVSAFSRLDTARELADGHVALASHPPRGFPRWPDYTDVFTPQGVLVGRFSGGVLDPDAVSSPGPTLGLFDETLVARTPEGDVLWQRDEPGRVSRVLARTADIAVGVGHGSERVGLRIFGLDLETGLVLWETERDKVGGLNALVTLHNPASVWTDGNVVAYALGSRDQEWNPVTFTALDVATGEVLWEAEDELGVEFRECSVVRGTLLCRRESELVRIF